ncbi:RNA 2',3'-cyclic phosphodiesterase [Gluconacetobacter sacchari]|uniref:RNA 2',3'-cyclic phosphodiesterase n=2 Tax=Gluconacetobacter sacchari TaxID=92759 RepID=A0A7W4NRY3_9PROT|nr:RNA 2',3'-cyclic phosphodiesterase [Gluconacetobacter sacchari]MBB2161488.1 RNA 2',3'-cyclic phosphodiesterase [Gluconacetobacter sacchari]GBQ30811.1 2'-5' RNA ligase [Gluconacetobacter sacchari DSM 12717]
MRLFVALDVGSPLREAIAALRGSLAGVSWVDPATYHVTLCFLGEVSGRNRLEDIDMALSAIRAPAIDLMPGPPGVFEQGSGRQSLWVGIARTAPLLHLHRKVETAMRRADFAIERRRFHPHVTIGALAAPAPEMLAAWLARWSALPLPPVEIPRLTLFRSLRGPDQASYEPIVEYDLAG